MEKRLVTRYAMRSAESANENQRRVEGVFEELAAAQPGKHDHADLREGGVDQQTATLVGAYITTID